MHNRRKPGRQLGCNCPATWPSYTALSTGECCVGCWDCSCPVFLLCLLHGWTSGTLSHSAVGRAEDTAPSSSSPHTPQDFWSCPTSSCLYRHCSYFNFVRIPMILTFPWRFQALVFLSFFTSSLTSACSHHKGHTWFFTWCCALCLAGPFESKVLSKYSIWRQGAQAGS